MIQPLAGPDLSGLPPQIQAFLKACPIGAGTAVGEFGRLSAAAPDTDFTPGDEQDRQHWHVLQTGFDLGLHFLATWWAWEQTPTRPPRLFFTAVTNQALPDLLALKSLSVPASLRPLQDEWLAAWSGMTPGTHRLVLAGGRVQLSLHSGQTHPILKELAASAPVDTVLLDPDFFAAADVFDGPSRFLSLAPAGQGAQTPSSLQRLQALSRLCRVGTRVCVALPPDQNHVLAQVPDTQTWMQCGFKLDHLPEKAAPPTDNRGINTLATYAPAWENRGSKKPGHRSRINVLPTVREALVLGAGLSGSAVAHSLASRGWTVTVIDQSEGVGAGASGLPAGLTAPHVSPDDNVLSRITRAGVRATLQRAKQCLVNGSDWAHTGVFEHRIEGKRSLPAGALWPPSAHEWSTYATTQQVSDSGLPPSAQALWHGLAGWVRPRQLVAAQLQTSGVQVLWGQKVRGLQREDGLWIVTNELGEPIAQAPLLVVACAFDSLSLLRTLPGIELPLNPLRGQISYGRMTELTASQREQLPPWPVNGHGSFISGVPDPQGQPAWYIGSTFERQCEEAHLRSEDHAANQKRLATLLPALGDAMKPHFDPDTVRGWAGLRCTLPDRLPAIGPVNSTHWPGLWISSGMGARGISLSVLCGELMAAWLDDEPLPLAPSLARHLAAARFNQA